DRVESQRRLPRPRHAGDNDQRAAREIDIDPLQVVLGGATDRQDVHAGIVWATSSGGHRGHTAATAAALPVTLVLSSTSAGFSSPEGPYEPPCQSLRNDAARGR